MVVVSVMRQQQQDRGFHQTMPGFKVALPNISCRVAAGPNTPCCQALAVFSGRALHLPVP
jgi:hypothetical protein